MAQQFGNRPAPKWTPFNLKVLTRYGSRWNPEDKTSGSPSLKVFVTLSGNVGFKMYMNDGTSTSSIRVPLAITTFNQLFEILKKVANSTSSEKYQIDVKSSFKAGVRQEKPYTAFKITTGKDGEGVVYLAIQPKDMKQAVFKFLPSYTASIIGSDNEPLSPSAASVFEALGWVNFMSALVTTYMATLDTDPDEGKDAPAQRPAASQNSSSTSDEWGDYEDVL